MLVSVALALLSACGSKSDMKPAAKWSAGTALPIARFEAYGATANGRVYFIGGITGIEGDMSTAKPSRRIDIFDPNTQTWTPGPDLPADAPKHHLTVAVWKDAIYVLGGFDGILGQNSPFLPIGVAYVLEGTTWRKLAPPPVARGAATAQAIDGRIFVTGGAPNEGLPAFSQLDVYDIAADQWTTKSNMPTAREHLASCAVNGTMIVVGGWSSLPNAKDKTQAAAEQYDPLTDHWTQLPDMPTARGGLGAVAIGSSCHVVGGEDWNLPPPGTFSAHEVYDVSSGRWTTETPMPTARHGLGLGFLGGVLYAIGGGPGQGNTYTAIVETLRP